MGAESGGKLKQRNPGLKSSWSIRRRFMFVVSAFCMWTIAYVLYKGLDSGPADTAVTMAFVALISIVGSYVFGATWEDVSIARLDQDGQHSGYPGSPDGGPAYGRRRHGGPAANMPAPGPGASTPIEDMP
jgi:hypothetical protein